MEEKIGKLGYIAQFRLRDTTAPRRLPHGAVPDPRLVLEMENGRVILPVADDLNALRRAPEWTKLILEAALRGRASA